MSTRQKRYRGHRTVKSRVLALVADGTIKDYDVDELAALLECSPRTICQYISAATRAPLATITPDMLPITFRDGKRMLIMIERGGYRDCGECVFEDMCRFLLSRDCYIACEVPLRKDVEE